MRRHRSVSPLARALAVVAALAVTATLVVAGQPVRIVDPALAPMSGPPRIKPPHANQVPPTAAPDVLRQGGDTILDAGQLALPVIELQGTTIGFNNDYDEVCPFQGSTAPDVVYTFVPIDDLSVDIDMFGSAFDTKIYVYDADLDLVACNDDFYSDWTSKLENLAIAGGERYYLVIDGYGSSAGTYVLSISEYVPCSLPWLPGAWPEDEPPLGDGYIDTYNGGCIPGADYPVFQPGYWSHWVGKSGWYHDANGSPQRDTDWYLLHVPVGGAQSIEADAESPCFLFELGPQDCANVAVVQSVFVGPCSSGSMCVPGYVGEPVWIWIGPQTVEPPAGFVGNEFRYYLISNVMLAVETRTFSEVKALFR